MLNNWSNLSQLTDHINTTAKQLVSEGKVDYEHLDDSSETATPLILAVVDQLISTMRSQHVTGLISFLIIMTWIRDLKINLEYI